jgi:predicted transposase YbfD/YdcC
MELWSWTCVGPKKVDKKAEDLLDVKGGTVTLNAMGCQHKIADHIVKKTGDYVIALKENQSQLN